MNLDISRVSIAVHIRCDLGALGIVMSLAVYEQGNNGALCWKEYDGRCNHGSSHRTSVTSSLATFRSAERSLYSSSTSRTLSIFTLNFPARPMVLFVFSIRNRC